MVIRLVIFDMDDVLYAYDLPKRLAAMGEAASASPAEVFDALWRSGFEESSDAGGVPDPDAYLAAVNARLPRPVTREQWVAARRCAMTPIAESLAIAEEVARVRPVAVLTNNSAMMAAEADAIAPEAKAIVGERFFASAALGAKKPNPEAFRLCLERLEASAAETFFVDDKPRNVEGARAAGLVAHQFRTPAGLRQALVELGVLVAA